MFQSCGTEEHSRVHGLTKVMGHVMDMLSRESDGHSSVVGLRDIFDLKYARFAGLIQLLSVYMLKLTPCHITNIELELSLSLLLSISSVCP